MKVVEFLSNMRERNKIKAMFRGKAPFEVNKPVFDYTLSMVYIHFTLEPLLKGSTLIPRFSDINDKNLHESYPALVGYLKDFQSYSNFSTIIDDEIPILDKEHVVRFLIEPKTTSGLYRYKKDSNFINGKRIAVDLRHALADYEMALIFTSVYNISSANSKIYKVTMLLDSILQEAIYLTSGLLTDRQFYAESNRFTKKYINTILELINEVTTHVFDQSLNVIKNLNDEDTALSYSANLDRLSNNLVTNKGGQ